MNKIYSKIQDLFYSRNLQRGKLRKPSYNSNNVDIL